MRRRTSAGQVLDVLLEVVDRLVEAVEELEEGVGCVVDAGLEDAAGGGLGVDACRNAVDRRELRRRPVLRTVTTLVGVATRSSSRYSARPSRRAIGYDENREDAMPVPLAAAAEGFGRPRRLGEDLHRFRVEGVRERREELVPVGSTRSVHSAATTTEASDAVGGFADAARDDDAETDNAACRCSLSQRSASSAAAQPEPAAVTAWRYTWS